MYSPHLSWLSPELLGIVLQCLFFDNNIFDMICFVDKTCKQMAYLHRNKSACLEKKNPIPDYDYKMLRTWIHPHVIFEFDSHVCRHYLKIKVSDDHCQIISMGFFTNDSRVCFVYYYKSFNSYHSFRSRIIGRYVENIRDCPCNIMCIEESEPIVITFNEDVVLSRPKKVYIQPLTHITDFYYYGEAYTSNGITKMRLFQCSDNRPPARELICECIVGPDGTISFNLSIM
jgi:hypothetical protein